MTQDPMSCRCNRWRIDSQGIQRKDGTCRSRITCLDCGRKSVTEDAPKSKRRLWVRA